MKRGSIYQNKHLTHKMELTKITVAHHKYVMRCADCRGAFVKWATKEEFEIANQWLLNF
tara:strand:+ start:1015 stop:1191 length:177 start_codon:yes stop_codon:yes gene_type:complete